MAGKAVLVGVEGGVASAFRQIQAALPPWLARTPDELTSANSAASVLQSAAMVGGPTIAADLLAAGTAQVTMLVSCGLVAAVARAASSSVRSRSCSSGASG